MKLTKTQLTELFSFQANNPITVTEDIIEDIEIMVKYAKSNITVSIGTDIYKYFTENNGKYTLYYVSGYDDLMNRLDIVLRKSLKVYANGGVPIFVEG